MAYGRCWGGHSEADYGMSLHVASAEMRWPSHSVKPVPKKNRLQPNVDQFMAKTGRKSQGPQLLQLKPRKRQPGTLAEDSREDDGNTAAELLDDVRVHRADTPPHRDEASEEKQVRRRFFYRCFHSPYRDEADE